MDWNLILEKVEPKTYKIIFPDERTGELPPLPKEGMVVRWPINPYFTGRAVIATLLECEEKFKGYSFTY